MYKICRQGLFYLHIFRVSVCCLTPSDSICFSYILARTSYISWNDPTDVRTYDLPYSRRPLLTITPPIRCHFENCDEISRKMKTSRRKLTFKYFRHPVSHIFLPVFQHISCNNFVVINSNILY